MPGEYAGTFTLRSNTKLMAAGAKFTGSAGGPALDVPVSQHDIEMSGFEAGTTWDQSVIRLGRNDSTQNVLALAPVRITLKNVTINSFRGKRGIEVNAGDVKILNCKVVDVYDPAGRDSQAICVLNSPGNILIDSCELSAGSENILTGGDTMKMAGVEVTGITITNNNIYKPLSWKTDGVSRGIKNLIELKRGKNVLIKNNRLDGCWVNGQDGYAFVITPRAGGDVHDVLLEDNIATNVGAGVNILGRNDKTDPVNATPSPVSGLVIRRFKVNAQAKVYGGRGCLALITGGPQDVTFDDCTSANDGSKFLDIDCGRHVITNPDATTSVVFNYPIGSLTVTNSRVDANNYGIFIGSVGPVNATNWQQCIGKLVVTGNTIATAPSTLKAAFPTATTGNTYVDQPTFDALVAPYFA